MKDRLQKFMESERLTSSRLAEIMGVQPSNISHILGGRNKPSFEFIEKMLQRFPKINPDWLLLGKGPVYRSDIRPVVLPEIRNERPADVSLFPEETAEPEGEKPVAASELRVSTDENAALSLPSSVERKRRSEETTVDPESPVRKCPDEIDYIIVFYKDKSFIRYRPK